MTIPAYPLLWPPGLRLALKDDVRLRPLTDGIDFLGYVVRPTHTLVRRRVVAHAREAFADFERQHVDGGRLHATPAQLRRIQSTAASYAGHLRHASAYRLQQSLRRRFPWLAAASVNRRFHHGLEGRTISILCRARP